MEESIGVLHLLPDLALGGGQQVLAWLLAAPALAQFEHHIAFFGRDRSMARAFEAVGAHLHFLEHRGLGSVPRVLGGLIHGTAGWGIHLIHTNGTPEDHLYGELVAGFTRLPLVRTLHGGRPRRTSSSLRPRAISRRVRARATDRIQRTLDPHVIRRFIAVSEFVARDWEPYLASCGIPSSRAEVIYTGVPVESYSVLAPSRRSEERRRLGLPAVGPLLITVARLRPGKNVHAMVECMATIRRRFPDATLVVVGEGAERRALDVRIAAAGLQGHVRLLGWRRDVPELLSASDLFLFSSRHEGFGLVVLEALASGLPVVSFELPPLRELAGRGAEITFVPQDAVDAMASAAVGLLEQPERRIELAVRGRRAVEEHWTAGLTAAQYAALYLRVLEEASVPSGQVQASSSR